MIHYEVNLKIDRSIYDEYMTWLKPHIEEMVNFDGFTRACLLQQTDLNDEQNKHITVLYSLKNQEALEHYLKNHAHHMRDDGIQRFGDKFSAGTLMPKFGMSFSKNVLIYCWRQLALCAIDSAR